LEWLKKIVNDYSELIREAVNKVKNMQGNIPRILNSKVNIPDISIPDPPMAGDLALNRKTISILKKTIKHGAAANKFSDAFGIGY
jgi:hypothetical protein